MTNKVRVGIIGTSGWTDTVHLPSFASHPAAEIAAICGRNQDRAQEMAAKYSIPHVYADYRALLEQDGLDAIVVAAPDDLHFPMTMDALDAGYHVLCEKPLALNSQRAREMVERAEAAGVKQMVLYTWRWQPALRYMKQLVDEGFIGDCNVATFYFCTPNGRQPEYDWHFDPSRANGVISTVGSHVIDFARWYVGDIAGVNARLVTCVDRPGADGQPAESANDMAFLNLEFANGAHGVIHVNMVAFDAEVELFLQGDAGAIRATFRYATGFTLEGIRHGETSFQALSVPEKIQQGLDPTSLFEPYVKQSAGPRYFIDAILEDKTISPNFTDGLKVQEVIDGAFESNQSGCWVDLT